MMWRRTGSHVQRRGRTTNLGKAYDRRVDQSDLADQWDARLKMVLVFLDSSPIHATSFSYMNSIMALARKSEPPPVPTTSGIESPSGSSSWRGRLQLEHHLERRYKAHLQPDVAGSQLPPLRVASANWLQPGPRLKDRVAGQELTTVTPGLGPLAQMGLITQKERTMLATHLASKWGVPKMADGEELAWPKDKMKAWLDHHDRFSESLKVLGVLVGGPSARGTECDYTYVDGLERYRFVFVVISFCSVRSHVQT